MSEPFRIAIIGAGFSGTVLAAQLLKKARPGSLKIVAVNRSGTAARGVAYGTNSPRHLLNVPTGRMSAFPDLPDQFLDFARSQNQETTASTFSPRSLYGEYLAGVLADAKRVDPGALEHRVGEIREIEKTENAVRLRLANGSEFEVDHAALTVGNYPPTDPNALPNTVLESPRYLSDPWAPGALEQVDSSGPALLIGTGLTMVDLALELRSRGLQSVIALSRRGLVPQPHKVGLKPAVVEHRPLAIESRNTIRGYLRAVRERIESLEPETEDWRQVVDSLRPLTPALWKGLSKVERERFFRHLRPYWDVHRHRIAPASFEALKPLRESGWLTIRAGRILSAALEANGIRVTWIPRGTLGEESGVFASVVNCTGPTLEVKSIRDPLLNRLIETGSVKVDDLGLGFEVADDGAVIGRDGYSSDWLSYVGPLLRARDGEGTAVPELRVYAEKTARRILELSSR